MSPRLSLTTADGRQPPRRGEPVTMGIPLPRAWCSDIRQLAVESNAGPIPLQAQALDRWGDGSVRWALLDFAPDVPDGSLRSYSVVNGPTAAPQLAESVKVDLTTTQEPVIDTGAARFLIRPDGELECHVPEAPPGAPVLCTFRLTDLRGTSVAFRGDRTTIEVEGPLRTVVLVEGAARTRSGRPLRLFIRYHFHAASPAVRIQVTLRNTGRAVHRGGCWDLGDPGSAYFRAWSFIVTIPGDAGTTEAFCSQGRGRALERVPLPFELYQDSSGGGNWASPNHVNRIGRIPVTFRGYRLRAGGREEQGIRATPVVVLQSGPRRVAVCQQRFWERFPKALDVGVGTLTLGLLPHQDAAGHELQGGEQITEEFVVSVGDDRISDIPLDWVREPLQVHLDREWYCLAAAVPFLTPANGDRDCGHAALVRAAIEGDDTFFSKRETVDEYGWRHFGDVYADHEAIRGTAAPPLVSHYNNQYDAIAGFARQFFRTGDLRWWTLLQDLARHVIDIDLYHTTEDRPAYNHGLFWHTAHYTDAARATHRTYSRATRGGSGGPSAEHNYSTGLMLYYFLTGDVRAREAAVDLGRWVIAMDDGAQSPFRWLSRHPTGLASATYTNSYHGPGRGAGNSIVALLNAYRLTSAREFLHKAEELICRCAHPADDISALNLLDAERRWSYTVFLRSVADYLDVKEECSEVDERHAYGRATLLHYARWMAEHEYPILDRPETLEFPTETWAAQDLRKSDVFSYAAKYGHGSERERFLARADFFLEYSVRTLSRMPTRTLARPVVLTLTNGHVRRSMEPHLVDEPPAPAIDFGTPSRFVPQRVRALRRVVVLGVGAAAVAAAALVALA